MKRFSPAAFLFPALLLACQSPASDDRLRENNKTAAQRQADDIGRAELVSLIEAMNAVKPFYAPMRSPQPGDWLESVSESGQTFAEYLHSNPTIPDDQRRVIYIQPLGEFSLTQRRIVNLTADYLSRFFNLRVSIRPDISLSSVPDDARRVMPKEVSPADVSRHAKTESQFLTGWILHDVLKPALPDDAAAMIAFTAADLWPGEGWNYLFGQASLRDRVGVWSIRRMGNPEASVSDFQLCLVRTLKLASHETGHMFSMQHCTRYECNLSGTNHLGETDRRPLDVCPECMAKVCYAMKDDPLRRYEKLREFCQVNGLGYEENFFKRLTAALRQISR